MDLNTFSRGILWNLTRQTQTRNASDIPWLIFGDFDQVLLRDKLNLSGHLLVARNFADVIHECGLIEINSVG